MKKTKILAGLLIAHVLNSCSLLPDTLPDETQSGKNTFGCLINGKVFTTTEMSGNFYGNNFTLRTIKDGSGVQFYIENLTQDVLGTYAITKVRNLLYTDGKCTRGEVNPPIKAFVTITKYERGEDKANNLRWLIISGTFEGILLPEGRYTDTIKITQGRFDVKFQ